MRLLLDTHIWLWSLLEPDRLAEDVTAALISPDNELWISPISIWEFLILVERGRVQVDQEPTTWVEEVMASGAFNEAPLSIEIAVQSRLVDLPHQDPADRFIAATAKVCGLTLVTADGQILTSKTLQLLPNR